MRFMSRTALLIGVLMAVTTSAPGQRRTTCGRCEVVLREMWHLDTASTFLTFWPRTVVGSRAHFYMVSLPQEVPFRVDRNGKNEEPLGRSGGGPGEFLGPTAIAIDRAQNVHVFDRTLGRRQVFNPSLKLLSASTIGATPVITALVLGNGNAVVNMGPGGGAAVQPLHLMDPAGKIIKSFGGDVVLGPGPEGFRPHDLVVRRLAASSTGGFWVAHTYDPVIEEYSAAGELVRRTTVASRKFVQRSSGSRNESLLQRGKKPLGSMVVGLWERADGSVAWVFLVPTNLEYRGVNRWQMFRTAIEIVDPANGEILATRELFSGEAIAVPETAAIAIYSEDADAQPRLVVYRVEINER